MAVHHLKVYILAHTKFTYPTALHRSIWKDNYVYLSTVFILLHGPSLHFQWLRKLWMLRSDKARRVAGKEFVDDLSHFDAHFK